MKSYDDCDPSANPILSYLESIPDYPFDADVDQDFVAELLIDFSMIDILDQIKAFRWHHNGRPARHCKSIRPAIRRWLAAARRFDSQPF